MTFGDLMKNFLLVILLFCFLTQLSAQSNNISVSEVVTRIDRQRITNFVTDLQSLGTRFMLTDKRFIAAGYLKGKFESMGFTDVKLDSFYCHTTIGKRYFQRDIDTTTLQINVVATLPGSEKPDDIYIICGHYDSFCQNADPFYTAPGADDNGSGTTCVLEAANAIMGSGYKPKATIKFICFAAEELGYFGDMGSRSYAYRAAERGDNIKLVINNDMIGFNAHNITDAKVNVAPTLTFDNIEEVIDICNTYGAIDYLGEGYAGADLMGFTEMGYPGIYFEENDFSIQAELNYHSSTDLAENIDFIYMNEVVKAATAVLLSMQDVLSATEESAIPSSYILKQNYPNPFNPTTKISYLLPNDSRVELKVFDVLGQEVYTIINKMEKAGEHQTIFKASALPSGVYFARLIALSENGEEQYTQVVKMILSK